LWKTTYCFQKQQCGKKRFLTEDEFKILASQQCHYCGIPFSGTTMDSSLEYTKENCVPCCLPCHRMKHDMSSQRFSEQVTRVYNHFCK
jgi:5-methylcytosine-specific restriction endonuclease McrA